MDILHISIQELLTLCVLTEAIVQTVKVAFSKRLSEQGTLILPICVSVLTALVLNVNILVTDHVFVDAMGHLFTGLLVSRGSNYVHDFVSAVQHVYQSNK